jgi:hypothetical protein
MEIYIQLLCARYPQYFSVDVARGVFRNKILNRVTDLKTTAPLCLLLKNGPEDFAIMMWDLETGYYYSRVGVICSSIRWNLGSKLGLKLQDIHQPIPDYKEKMAFSMGHYFAKLPTDAPI